MASTARPNRWFTFAITLATLLTMFGQPGATLARDTTYTMDTGTSIQWSSPWTLNGSDADDETGVETVTLQSDQGIVMLMAVPIDLDLDFIRDAVLEGLVGEADASVTIDRSMHNGISYSLDSLQIEGIDFGEFTTVRRGTATTPTFMTLVLAPTPVFATVVASAQQSISIDGVGIFRGVGGQGLQDQLEANSDLAEAPSQQHTDSVGSFTGSAFGVEIAWNGDWEVNENVASPISDDVDGIDAINLTRTDDDLGLLSVTIMPEVESGVDGLIDYWQTSSFLESVLNDPDGGIYLADSAGDIGAVIIVDYLDDGTQIVSYREAWYLSEINAYAVVVLTTIPQMLQSGIAAAQDGVTIAGISVLTYYSYEDIVAAAG